MSVSDLPIYSICMLCSNNIKTLDESVGSLLQVTHDLPAEIVVCDNMSTDGSWKALESLSRDEKVVAVRKRCSRGAGRQFAFQNSRGRYILSHMDCDDVFIAKGIEDLVERYHRDFEGNMMMANRKGTSNVTIAPRALVKLIGGWRDVNWVEDWDAWARAAALGRYKHYELPKEDDIYQSVRVLFVKRHSGFPSRFVTRFAKYRDSCRIGRPVFTGETHISLAQKLTYYLAKVTISIKQDQLEKVPNPLFNWKE